MNMHLSALFFVVNVKYDDTRVESHEWSAYTRYALRVCGPIHDFTTRQNMSKQRIFCKKCAAYECFRIARVR